MNVALSMLLGGVLGAFTLLATGLLSIQQIGLSGGAVLNLNNEVVAVTTPTPGVIPIAGIGLLTALILIAFVWRLVRRGGVGDRAIVGGFTAVLLVGVVVGMVMHTTWYAMPFTDLEQPFPPGWLGWLQRGAGNPASLTTLLFSIVLWMTYRRLANRIHGGRGRSRATP